MGVTAVQIADYLADVRLQECLYIDKLARKEKTGRAEIFSDKVIAAVLNCYVTIITDYFSQATYTGGLFNYTYNFFDAEEAEEIIFRINKICGTDYRLVL